MQKRAAVPPRAIRRLILRTVNWMLAAHKKKLDAAFLTAQPDKHMSRSLVQIKRILTNARPIPAARSLQKSAARAVTLEDNAAHFWEGITS